MQATMDSIAEYGLSGTTMATVTRKAGLSMGIANLHFDSKEKMLLETLQYVNDEYNSGQIELLSSDKLTTVAEKIEALLAFDFSPRVLQKNKLAVWVAFWGEAKARPTYQKLRVAANRQSENALRGLFQSAIDEGHYKGADADLLVRGYTALIDGLWLNLLVAPKQFNRNQALSIARHYLAGAFPEHVLVDASQNL